jgi:hypothetical protein
VVCSAIEPHLPIFVRKTPREAWMSAAENNVESAISEIFPEKDPHPSFFRVENLDDVITVAAFLSAGGAKGKPRPTYFFGLPAEVVEALDLDLGVTPSKSRCDELRDSHYELRLDRAKADALVREITARKLYGYRVSRDQIVLAISERSTHGCLDYAPGPCLCGAGAA